MDYAALATEDACNSLVDVAWIRSSRLAGGADPATATASGGAGAGESDGAHCGMLPYRVCAVLWLFDVVVCCGCLLCLSVVPDCCA